MFEGAATPLPLRLRLAPQTASAYEGRSKEAAAGTRRRCLRWIVGRVGDAMRFQSRATLKRARHRNTEHDGRNSFERQAKDRAGLQKLRRERERGGRSECAGRGPHALKFMQLITACRVSLPRRCEQLSSKIEHTCTVGAQARPPHTRTVCTKDGLGASFARPSRQAGLKPGNQKSGECTTRMPGYDT